MKVIAKKDLIHPSTPAPAFKKGQEYSAVVYSQHKAFSESTILLNEQKEPHRVGNWLKHFKLVCLILACCLFLGACSSAYHCPTYGKVVKSNSRGR